MGDAVICANKTAVFVQFKSGQLGQASIALVNLLTVGAISGGFFLLQPLLAEQGYIGLRVSSGLRFGAAATKGEATDAYAQALEECSSVGFYLCGQMVLPP